MSLAVLDLLTLTWDSLRGNPLRSVLTTVGVFMGVAAVNATLQVGNISSSVIAQQLAKREAPRVTVYVWFKDSRKLMLEDMEWLKRRLVGVQAMSTSTWFPANQIKFQDKAADLDITAVSENYLITSGRLILKGRFLNKADFSNYRPVVIIDELLSEQLFNQQNPINQRIYADGRLYIVVGVMETKLLYKDDKPRGQMLVPLSLLTAMTGRRWINPIEIRPYNLEDLNKLEEQVKKLLLQRFPGAEILIFKNIKDILEQRETLVLASRALTVVGAISLLVGGVGIANITIAAVIERTPEIGLRIAIGATQQDVLFQFILEAAILSLFGGLAAIIVVHGLTIVVSDTFKLPYHFDMGTATISLGSALLVGVGSGFLPALRASQLDPVKALRSS